MIFLFLGKRNLKVFSKDLGGFIVLVSLSGGRV
jgi:hypothetical protein